MLKLTINKLNFDLILSGQKSIEYRDISPFHISRFCDNAKEKSKSPFSDKVPFVFKPIDQVTLYVGYSKDRESAVVELKSITVEPFTGNGFAFDCFYLHLGRVVRHYPKS